MKVLVIDEVSMVSANLMDAIDAALRAARGKPKVPFGGCKIVMFGDPYQFKISEDGILDEPKRIKSFLSPRRTTFNNPYFNSFLDSLNEVDGIPLTEDDYGYHEHKDYATTVTLTFANQGTKTYSGGTNTFIKSNVTDRVIDDKVVCFVIPP